jgi:phage tail sheath protein FI
VQQYINQITVVVENPGNPDDPAIQQQVLTLNQNLSNALPPYQQWQNVILQKLNVLPPSGGMAGVYTLSDNLHGVWNSPANITMRSVISCTVNLTNDQQGPLNVPLNGKAVDVIRDFIGRGSVVWGARTLDGNSLDWRYIQVRRTIVYIEQSIKTALQPFVFSANDGQTWVAVTSMISNFLQNVWSQGGLMGDRASDAFTVQCGLGSTMTAQDILNGYMIVQVTLQMVRPAEFIELTFKQQMQGA